LEGDYSEYQVDVAWAHSMTGGDKESKRERAGRVWETFESKPKTKATPPHTGALGSCPFNPPLH